MSLMTQQGNKHSLENKKGFFIFWFNYVFLSVKKNKKVLKCFMQSYFTFLYGIHFPPDSLQLLVNIREEPKHHMFSNESLKNDFFYSIYQANF